MAAASRGVKKYLAPYRTSLTISPALARHARGGFRTIVNEAGELARMANASGIKTITETLVKQLS
jgi:hypothetical protein